MDHLLADDPDPGHRADRHRRARRARHARPAAEGDHLDLSVLLPGHHRHGEGPHLARPDPARPDAHLLGDTARRSSGSCAGRRRCRFLFASLKVAIAIRLVGAIVGELPTGAQAGIGARLLTGSYYGQTVQIWAALFTAALMAAVLVAIVGCAERLVAAPHGSAARDGALVRGAASSHVGACMPSSAARLHSGDALSWLRDRGAVCTGAGASGAAFWAAHAALTLALVAASRQRSPDAELALATPARPYACRRLQDAVARASRCCSAASCSSSGRSPCAASACRMYCCRRPSAIAARFAGSLPILVDDFVQTFLRGVLPAMRSAAAAGFVVAIVADRVAFLRRGLLPLGNLVSALPIVGIAPIMVMWFGFDWPSKAAVVVVMTFFPDAGQHGRRPRRRRRNRARPDALLRGRPLQTLVKLQPAGGHAVHLQCAQDQLDPGPDRRHRGGVLRHADRRHGLSHLDRGRPHVARHGVGRNRGGGAGRLGVLWGRSRSSSVR